jgi:Flp pilus assembly CpaE family ATPase
VDKTAESEGAVEAHYFPTSASSIRTGRPAEVVLGIRDLALHQEVLDFLDRDPRINVAGALTEPHRLLALSADVAPDATILCPTFIRELRHPAARGRLGHPIVLAEELTVPLLRDAISGGAQGVFAWPEEREELTDAIVRVPSAEHPPSTRGRVIAVHGTRGGVGATFLASHLAAVFTDQGFRTALVDLESGFASLTVALGVEPRDGARSVRDLVPVANELSPEHLDDALFRHPRGFAVLLGPPNDAPPADVPAGLYSGSVALLACEYDMVVLHVPRFYDAARRGSVAISDQVVLVATLDPYAVHGAVRAIGAFGLEDVPERCRLVINRHGRGTIRPRDVERVIGLPCTAVVGFDPKVRRAMERGRLLRGRARGAARDVLTLSQALVDVPAARRS